MSTIWYLIVKLVVSALALPIALQYLEPSATFSTKTLLALCTFLVWSSFDALYYLRKVHDQAKREHDLWSIEHDLDIILNNIRGYYRQIVKDFYGEDDLFR